MRSIGFLGMGNMGQAIARGLKKDTENTIYFYDISPEASARAVENLKITSCDTPEALVQKVEVIILAVKPQYMEDMLKKMGPLCDEKRIITIAAGLPLSFYEQYLKTADLVRFMPNMAAAAGSSTTAICPGARTCKDFVEEAKQIAEAFGEGVLLPENLIPAFIGVSGSGIAYVFSFLHSLALGGVREGIGYQQSLDIALKTLEGAAKVVSATGEHPIELLSKVISPAGTTIEGVSRLENSDFSGTVIEAVGAAAERARNIK